MPKIRVANFRQQGVDLIVVPLDRSFDFKTEADQRNAILEIQLHAKAANMPGTVVPVWDGGGGRMKFIAPKNWHPFFKSIGLPQIMRNVNRELSW